MEKKQKIASTDIYKDDEIIDISTILRKLKKYLAIWIAAAIFLRLLA